MKGQKVKKISIRVKILLPVIVVLVLACSIMGVSSYIQFKNAMIEMGVEEADMASVIAEKALDGDALAKLEPCCEERDDYQTLLAAMRDIQKSCSIEFLYTLYTDGKQVYYGIDTDESENQAKVGDVFEESYQELADVFGGEKFLQDFIDYTESGNLISVYRPVYNSAGEVVAVIGCDYNASGIIKRLNSNLQSVIIIAVICLVVSIVIINIIVSLIMRKLHTVDRKIYDLVHSEGDLTQKLEIHTGDEMELIADNVNTLLEYIRKIMLNISENSKILNKSSRHVVDHLSAAELNISDVSANMEEMSATMEETSASLNQINESVLVIYETIEGISKNANAGRNSSDNIMGNVEEIYQNAVIEQKDAKIAAEKKVETINEKIKKSKAVEEISSLTENIINITNQTKMLALNASIEAARAGEAGRGFAVVADEIGKLAVNSAEMAEEIRRVSAEVVEAVNELTGEAEDMLTFMEKTAMKGYQKLLETSGNYRNDVENMNHMMKEFAMESGQLKDSMDSIKGLVYSVNIAVEESARSVTNATEKTVDLTSDVSNIENEADSNMNIASQLNDEVNKFKL